MEAKTKANAKARKHFARENVWPRPLNANCVGVTLMNRTFAYCNAWMEGLIIVAVVVVVAVVSIAIVAVSVAVAVAAAAVAVAS